MSGSRIDGGTQGPASGAAAKCGCAELKKTRFRWKIADSSGQKMTGGKTLAATLILQAVDQAI